MMAAAQAAAEAALQEALANDGSQQAAYSYPDEGGQYANPATYGAGGGDNMRLMESLHATDPGGQALLLQDLMGMSMQGNLDDDNTHHLLQLLAKQEQHQQEQFSAAAEAVLDMRPEKHYLTISQNGE
jgi:hypothetical protein